MAEPNYESTGEGGEKNSFFAQNKRLVVLLAIMGVLVIVAVVVNFGFLGEDDPGVAVDEEFDEEALEEEESVGVLPQTEREVDWEADRELSQDPFLGPIELVGTVTGSSGDNYAIIVTDTNRVLAREGDVIYDSWEVKAVTTEVVLLESDAKMTEIGFSD